MQLGWRPSSVQGGPCLLLAWVLGSCAPHPERTFDSGVRVEWLEEGRGETLTETDWVLAHYDAWTSSGEWVDTTRDDEEPYLFPSRQSSVVIPGLEEALRALRVGDRVKVTLPASSAYAEIGKPPRVPPHTELVYELEVLQRLELLESGLRLGIRDGGEGDLPRVGQWAVVDYVMRHPLTGRELDRSNNTPLEFQLGQGTVLAGLEEAVGRLRPGSRAVAVLPPSLAFGERGNPPWIPPGAEVLYELSVRGFHD